MNDSDSDSSIPFATPVEPPKPRLWLGCFVAVAIAGLGGLFVFGLVAGVSWIAAKTSIVPRQRQIAEQRDLRAEAVQDIRQSRMAILQPTAPQHHPDYERIVKFIERLRSALDDTANPKLKRLVDYDLCMSEVLRRSKSLDDNRLKQSVVRRTLENQTVGPAPFTTYEITRIEKESPDRYRVYLSYPSSYITPEPQVWWLSDNGELKIYDWSLLESSIRFSRENATICDASNTEVLGYSRYINLCNQRFDTEELDLSFSERKLRVKLLLSACELFNGPAELRPIANLNTAQHWYHEREYDRALAMLETITTPDIVPGVYRLAGDIHFDLGEFDEALKSYRQFIELLGPTPYAQSRLAACYRELGDKDLEREALLVLTRSISELNFAAVAQLVERNNNVQNLMLYARIDELDCHDAAYLYLVRHFGESDFFADRLEQIREHLQKTWPQSDAWRLANLELSSDIDTLMATLKWIDEKGEEDPEGLRYRFWYDLDETRMVEVLERSENLEQDFETICNVNDYEGSISFEVMEAACQRILKSNPDNFNAHYQLGVIHNFRQEFKLAIGCLQKALAAIPEAHENVSFVRSELLNAFYLSGDHSAAIDMANDAETAVQLLALKTSMRDFSNFDQLLERLDGDSIDFMFYKATLNDQQENTDEAIRILVGLLNEVEVSEEIDYRADSYRDKLIEFCEKQNDAMQAFTLVPTDAMLSRVTGRYVEAYDWPNCERLLRSPAVADKKLLRVQLRQRLDWEQGKYKQVVDQANAVLELAKTEDLSEELERLVRAAVRVGELDKAMQFAKTAWELADRHDLVVLVALHQRDGEQAARHLRRLSSYGTDLLVNDPDLMNFAWREVIPPSHRLRRSLFFTSGRSTQFDLRLLFSEPQELGPDQLRAALGPVLGDDLSVEQIVLDEVSRGTWLVQTQASRLVISQEAIDGVVASATCDLETLNQAIKASTSQVRVVALATAPTTAQANRELLVAVTKRLSNEKLRAVEHLSHWLTAEDFFRWRDQVTEPSESASPRLFGRGEFEGVFFYLNTEAVLEQEPLNGEFLKGLVSALKRFDDSAETEPTLTVQFNTRLIFQEPINARVNGLHFSEYGDVALHATILSDSKFDPSIRENDEVEISLYQVDRFELQTSGETIQQSRTSD